MKKYENLDSMLGRPKMQDNIFMDWLQKYRLEEKTFDLDNDVDFIYDKFFKKYMDLYVKTGIFPVKQKILIGELHSSELKTKEAKEANEKDPIIIKAGISYDTGAISYKKNNRYILVCIDLYAIEHVNDSRLTNKDKKSLENILSENYIKSVIYHELSHWVSDVKYHNYISILISKALKLNVQNDKDRQKINKILNLNKIDKYMTNYEIDAVIHGIKQTKRMYKKEWDKWDLMELFYRYGSLRNIAKRLNKIDKKVYYEWLKDLTTRMHREGLLGKNMKNFPKSEMIEQYEVEQMMLI